jgi:hypothetical protein
MDNATNPEAGVVSLEDRMLGKLYPEMAEAKEPEQGNPEQAENQQPEPEAADEAPQEDNAEPEAEAPSESLEEVEFEGRQYQVPKELKDALMRQSDYTRKTQEAAEMRKQAEATIQHAQMMSRMQTELAPELGQLNAIDQRMQEFQKVDWMRLAQEDPNTASQLRIQYDILRDQKQQLEQTIGGKKQQMQEQHAQFLSKQVEEGARTLAQKIKGWGPDLQRSIIATGKTYGFSDEEIGGIVDPRAVEVLHDAHQWRQLQASKPQVTKKAAEAPRSLKPQAQATTNAKQDRANFRRALTNTKDDSGKAKLIEQALARRFG